MSLATSHSLGGRVKATVREQIPRIGSVVVHMEPFAAS
jgi:divalent metal cation (Fe/Co/Zn/Cd) transporter